MQSAAAAAMEHTHRRSQSDAAGLLEGQGVKDTAQAPSHVRSVSLGSSASQFLQSLKLQDPAAFQHSLLADQLALPDQHTPHAAAAAAGADFTAAAASAGNAGAVQDRGAVQSARSKRAHRGSNGRNNIQDAMQLDTELPEQQPLGFTPLPAVVENSVMDSERDWDSDSGNEGFGPNRRGGSRAGGRRGGCNGRSESELMLLDPKRVKRILANRESAARSKERRMNYTMELEGKLQALAVETDKLSSQLTSLNKQEGKLRASKADLEQQVHGMQQQLAQVVSENHSLMSTLFQLQAAMGLPQALPDGPLPYGMQEHPAAAGAGHYQPTWQHQYADSKQPTSPKPRKPRRHSKHQQQHGSKQQQWVPYGAWTSSSYGAPAEPDLSDPAAAAAAPVAELPVRPKSNGAASAVGLGAAGQVHHTAADPAAAAAVVAAAAGHVGGSLVGVSVAPQQALNTQQACALAGPPPPPAHVSPRQHQWHTGLGGPSSTNSTPAVAPQPHSAAGGHHSQQLPAAAVAVAAFTPAAPHVAGVAPHAGSFTGGVQHASGGVQASSGTAAGAACLLGQQLPAPGVDAVMGDAEDDLAMLGAFLEEEDEPSVAVEAASTHTAAAAAAVAASAAAPGASACGGGMAAVSASAWPPHGHAAGSGVAPALNGYSPRQAAAGVAGMPPVGIPAAAAAAAAGGCGYRMRSSPALSDPVAGEVWHPAHEELSSGSVGGSFTQGATPNLTPSGRLGSEGVNGVSPAYAAGGWQQHQQHHQQQQYVGAGVAAPGGGGAAAGMVSPMVGAGAVLAGAASAGGCPQVSPITPDSSRVRTPRVGSSSHPGGVSAVTVTTGMPPAALAPASPHFQQHQQPQHQVQHQVQFVIGANPSASWSGRGRHVRSASTGCMSGLAGYAQGYDDHLALLTPSSNYQAGAAAGVGAAPYLQHPQQQQQQQRLPPQQQQPLGSMLAAQHHASLPVQQHTSLLSETTAVMGFSTEAAAVAEFSQAAGMASAAAPGAGQQRVEGLSWQRHRRSHSHAAAFMGQGGLMGQYDFAAS